MVELQDIPPAIPVPLSEVGVVDVKVPLNFEYYKGRKIVVVPRFEAFVNLSAEKKGIHASRQYETILEILAKYAGKTYKLENVCTDIAYELLNRQDGATKARVKAVGEVILERKTPVTGQVSYEPYRIMASATALKHGENKFKIKRKVGVGVRGMTACPCAQELMIQQAAAKISESDKLAELTKKIPVATHMQRSYGLLVTSVPRDDEIDAFKLTEIVENSMSAPSFGLLKRPDEAEIVRKAAEKPLFAEDVIRLMMVNFAKAFPSLPDETVVLFKVRSEESIHKHDLVAKRKVTLKVLRAEMEANGVDL
jgi:GTP cyclohydrolase-4